MAMITVSTLERNSDTMAIASRMAGIAINPSMMRMMMASRMRKKPASRPMNRPTGDADQRHRDADQQRDARAIDHPAVDVAPQSVGSEQGDHLDALAGVGADRELRAGDLVARDRIDRGGIDGAEPRRQQPHQHHDRDDGRAEHHAGIVQQAANGRGSASPAPPRSGCRGSRRPSVADPWIEQRVDHVDREVDHDVDEREQQDHGLDRRIVARQHRIDGQPAEARNREHAFGDDDAADQ